MPQTVVSDVKCSPAFWLVLATRGEASPRLCAHEVEPETDAGRQNPLKSGFDQQASTWRYSWEDRVFANNPETWPSCEAFREGLFRCRLCYRPPGLSGNSQIALIAHPLTGHRCARCWYREKGAPAWAPFLLIAARFRPIKEQALMVMAWVRSPGCGAAPCLSAKHGPDP